MERSAAIGGEAHRRFSFTEDGVDPLTLWRGLIESSDFSSGQVRRAGRFTLEPHVEAIVLAMKQFPR